MVILMRILKKALGISRTGGCFEITTDSVPLRVWFVADDILRIRAGFEEIGGARFHERSYTLALTAWPDDFDGIIGDYRERVEPAFCIGPEDAGNKYVLKGHHLELRVYKDPLVLEIADSSGVILHRDIPLLAYREDCNGRRIHTCELNDSDCYYGFGEHGGSINKLRCYVRESGGDTMGYDPIRTDPLYKHIPFYVRLNGQTGQACGYFYHTTYECAFDVGCSHSNYWHKHSSCILDGGDIDLFFIRGPEIADVTSRYTRLTGRPALLPRSALGYLGSSMYYSELPENSDQAIVSFVDQCLEEQIPVDGFQLSSGYCEIATPEGEKRCTFNWDKRRFPDPEKFFAEMSARGITVSPNVKPGQLLVNPWFKEMKEQGCFVRQAQSEEPEIGLWWGGPGAFFDYTSPQARAWWKQKLKEQVLRKGTYSVWNDNCEFESIVDRDARVCLEGQGGTIGAYKSEMANLMCQITVEAIAEENPDVRPFVVCRSGHSGIQRYAQTWAGDNYTCWEALKYNIGTILNMGISGVPNEGCDIGGFYGPAPEAELLVRWVQNGIFQPRFSIHSTNTDNTVTEPWMYRSKAELIREAVLLRYRLSAHLYSLMYRAHECGRPIMEALCMAYQQDPKVHNEGVNFVEGGLFVSNIVEPGEQEHQIYFPKGDDFYDFYSYRKYAGGSTVKLPVTQGSIPLFLRSGSIVPVVLNPLKNLARDKVTDLEFKIAGGRSGTYVFYEDDGVSNAYLKGLYLKTRLEFTESAGASVLKVHYDGAYVSPLKHLRLSLIHPGRSPLYVKVDGIELPRILRDRDFERAYEGWYYDHDRGSVEVKYAYISHDYQVEISYENFDLLGM